MMKTSWKTSSNTAWLVTGLVALCAAGATRAAQANDHHPLALGAKAPLADAKLKNATTPQEVSIAKVAGPAGTLVVFTANGCPFAQAWEERIVNLGNTYGKKGVGVLLINSNNPAASKSDTFELMQARAKARGMTFPYAVDPESTLAQAFGAAKTPEAYLFDKGGQLVYHGTIDDNHEDAAKVTKPYLKDALDAVVAGKKPPAAETKSLGCGIKFPKTS
jgi:peroxiredoxin